VTLKPGAGVLSRSLHDEFLELCAISTSGQLTGDEQNRLEEHLAICPSCREAMTQYNAVVGKTISALALDRESVDSDPSWSQEQQEQAEAALFQRLTRGQESGPNGEGKTGQNLKPKVLGRVQLSTSQATWRNVWTLYAAGVLLFVALGVSAYQVGIHRGVKAAGVTPYATPQNQAALEQQLSDAGHEREVLRAQTVRRGQTIADLRHQLEQQAAAIGRLKLGQNHLESELQNAQAGRQGLLQERSELNQELDAAQAKTQGLLDRVESLDLQSSQEKSRAKLLETKVTDLTQLLHDRDEAMGRQDELLAHDRDIRELMGARDLYFTEVYDVGRNAETKKPYGRVFYTKGKSLIFYAYDLDQQTGVKNARTFQAWGRRGPDWQQALNLGMFYVDNASKKRWVLRLDDPKTLAQIDAVFVTIEPKGGSHKPSSKPLLFAYLHIDPNHP